MRQINARGEEIIKRFESLKLQSYRCPAGVWTIGWGHTGKDVHPGLEITPEDAQRLFLGDVSGAQDSVDHMVTVPLTDNQFSALVSFAFNCGPQALRSSTLLRLLNSGNYRGAADQFLQWTHCNGETLTGLVNRRKMERELFLTLG